MNDLNIQGSRAYAAAYATNNIKTQAVAPTTTNSSASSPSNSDTVSISAEAKELFQQLGAATNSSSSHSGSNTTNDNSTDIGTPIVANPSPVTPMNGGGGVRPPENP